MPLRRWFGWIMASLVLPLAFSSCGASRHPLRERLPVVEAAPVTAGAVMQTIQVNGLLTPMPNHAAVIRPPFAGIVDQIIVAPNQAVKKNQVVARMFAPLLRAEVLQAKANLAAAGAALANARRNFAREQELFHDGLVSQKSVQDGELTERQAKAAVTVDVNELKTKMAQLSLSVIRSPLSGVVAAVSANNGEMVEPSVSLLTIVDANRLQLIVSIRSRDLSLVRSGEPVRFTTDSFPGKFFTGAVAGVGAQVDPATGMIPVTVLVKNGNRLLRDGMIAAGRIIVGSHRGLLVPQSAVLVDPVTGAKTIVLIGKDGFTRVVAVNIGLPSGNMVEITQGVREGENVAVSGQYALPNGTKVGVKAVNPDGP